MRFLRSLNVALIPVAWLLIGCAGRGPATPTTRLASGNSCHAVAWRSQSARPELGYLRPMVQAAVDQIEADQATASRNDMLFLDVESLRPRLMELHGTAYTAENIRAAMDRDFCIFEGEGLVGDVTRYGNSWQVLHFGSLVSVPNRLIATVWSVAPCFERNCLTILRLELEEANDQWTVRDKRVIGQS